MESEKPSAKPVLLAVDDEQAALGRIERELTSRYANDYRIVCEGSCDQALAKLKALRAAGEDVALVLVSLMEGQRRISGPELLARAREMHPHAKRGMLLAWGAWGDRRTRDAVLKAMGIGDIDYYVLRPWWSPDEQFHRTIAEFLYEWTRAAPYAAREVQVIGDAWSPRSHELRSLLARNGVPHVSMPEARRSAGSASKRPSSPTPMRRS